ncbi:MAG: glycosyltransferase family 4 protein [Verrucomicrobiota bacterium]
MHSFAYLFERFPSFVQTFVYREAMEMGRQAMHPKLVSLRRPEDPESVAEKLAADVFYLPEPEEMRTDADRLQQEGKLPRAIHHAIREARKKHDSNRIFEAVWLGPRLRGEGITHVHAHFGGMAARTAWWLRKLHGITYSFTGHANDIFCENEFPVSNADLVREAKFVVTETDYARQWMEQKHPRALGKVFRVYNGIDRDFPPRKPLPALPLILSVGRYVEKKGFTDLIESCRLLRNRGERFECRIVGGGPLQETLDAQINEAGLQEVVRLLGPRSQNEVRQLLSEAHLFVLACVPESAGGSDNLPTVIMEAMMCGVPVVSTRVAGVPEMIRHDRSGLLVEPRNPAALAEAIARLLRNPELGETFSMRGHETATASFPIENTTRLLKHLLVREAGVKPPAEAFVLDPDLPRGWLHRWFGKSPSTKPDARPATRSEG